MQVCAPRSAGLRLSSSQAAFCLSVDCLSEVRNQAGIGHVKQYFGVAFTPVCSLSSKRKWLCHHSSRGSPAHIRLRDWYTRLCLGGSAVTSKGNRSVSGVQLSCCRLQWRKTSRKQGIVCSAALAVAPIVALGELVRAGSNATTVNTSHALSVYGLAAVSQAALVAMTLAYTATFSSWREDTAVSEPEAVVIEGIEVTEYQIFRDPEVLKAIEFARVAHAGQFRRTGEPYVTHCIHTAKILAALVPAEGTRAVETVVAGVLHDVVDDTCTTLKHVKKEFGESVANLVEGVSRLSHINQLLRRQRRTSAEKDGAPENSTASLTGAEVDSLRVMLLGMINDPRVVLIKLADRLHNMRTVYALPTPKATAVAQETLAVWCSLAARLGVWGVKAELEDLCFAVLQPQIFRRLRSELAALWTPSDDWRFQRRQELIRAKIRIERASKPKAKANSKPKTWIRDQVWRKVEENEEAKRQELRKEESEEEPTMQDLLEAVVPFDLLTDEARRKRTQQGGSVSYATRMLEKARGSHLAAASPSGPPSTSKPKVARDAAVALAALGACEDALGSELFSTTPYVPGMEITLSGRLKSLYSTHCKMRRKGVGLAQIFDARALRVVVGDGDGEWHVAAVEGCYDLLRTVHGLWPPLSGEFDDYIINPKQTGYQSLHTAVMGPDGAPLEIQIRTRAMHEHAEYGHAAHWMYKEGDNMDFSAEALSTVAPPGGSSDSDSDREDNSSELQRRPEGHPVQALLNPPPLRVIRPGQPALRVELGRLLAAVVVKVENEGRELLVAVSFALWAREAVAAGRARGRKQRWETYARLLKKVKDNKWWAPGHGDLTHCLEKYTLGKDGIYHKEDVYGYKLATFIQMLDMSPEEEAEYADITAKVAAGLPVGEDDVIDDERLPAQPLPPGLPSKLARLNNKVRLLRSMLQWEQEICHETGSSPSEDSPSGGSEKGLTLPNWALDLDPKSPPSLGEVLVIRWPNGEIVRLPPGSTAADMAKHEGHKGIVFVDGKAVLPKHPLKDGDLVELR